MTELFTKYLPQVIILIAVSGFIGWLLRGKPAPVKAAPVAEKGQDRAKNLEAALEKSKAAHKALKAELETLQANSISKSTFEAGTAELDAVRKDLDTATKRIATLETDLKKSQETLKTLNARTNEADKAQKDRSFALENELSKTREQLAILQNRPDDSVALNAEIERLRESVAASTRYAGEMRKREAAAVEALEKAETKLANTSDTPRPTAAPKKIGPVGDSDRIAAAKAEVIRLLEMNKAKETAAEIEKAPVIAVEEEPVVLADEPVVSEEVPVVKKAPISGDLFTLD